MDDRRRLPVARLAGLALALLAAVPALVAAPPALAGRWESTQGPLEVTEVARGFTEPWGFDFLPGGGVLVTERGGTLWHLRPDGSRSAVAGTPEVWARGQGGLLDVMVPRDFATSRDVFLSYARPGPDGAGTALGVGRLAPGGDRLEGFRVLYAMADGGGAGQHFGSRIVEAADGSLFVTVGDRGAAERAQDPARANGKILRLARDGSVPPDNPFAATPGAAPEVWSLGHRNPQGAALGPDGTFWAVEHGAMGGDEINRVVAGANYGWPVIAYGRNYDGTPIGEGPARPGLAQPEHYWDPSIAPSGLAVYSGALWPGWRGHLLVGSLKFDHLAVLDPASWGEEVLRGRETGRVRDVAEAPDGSIWFASVERGALFRITPAR